MCGTNIDYFDTVEEDLKDLFSTVYLTLGSGSSMGKSWPGVVDTLENRNTEYIRNTVLITLFLFILFT